MEVHEKVKIEVKQNQSYVGRVEQAPDRSFLLVPTDNPKLASTFQNINWNCVKKEIYATIKETTRFEAYQWFSKLNEIYSESQATSFEEGSSISLYFFDEENHEDSGGFKFTQLKLIDHSCDAHTESPDEGIFHNIVIGYRGCKAVFFRDANLDTKVDFSTDPNAKIDDEWRGVKIQKE